VYVGVGSNIDRETNIRDGIHTLQEKFGKLTISSVYESKPFGFEGDNFFNLVVGFDTALSLEMVASTLREIEFQYGRERQEQRFLSRTLDLDLLLYGDLIRHDDDFDLPREDVKAYSFVLCPLAEIVGDLRHPEDGRQSNKI
jgi:2-amino-4-hydroxy-6-hydroxymethyldihydropteridine diphosphokinase